ncbi:hypothetical protein [Thiorhodovibrio frisius]|uniref:Uncharacterized protein n=1 Tax=Thiorhodovibrio frisius TaxID=631362 RepID=H8YWG2_9GAMM|nr:hypothetical protein [Thiorhodovibrio frisius]EIC22788.1 hypothetical protein Thi970DRAFT_00423 [Thiorhodovibrio frisius]WPL22955.1 RNA polymerase sigma-70 factor [Thiorhodovibrio frisius]
MQYSGHPIWSKVEGLTKAIARKNSFPMSEHEDLVQDVMLKVWQHRNAVINKGKAHYGYLKACIGSVIAEHKESYIKNTDYGKAREYTDRAASKRSSGTQQQKCVAPEKTFPDFYLADHRYEGSLVSEHVLDGNMEFLRSQHDVLEESHADHLLSQLQRNSNTMRAGFRKDVRRLFLSGLMGEGSSQRKDIAVELNRDIKAVSDALTEIRKLLKAEIKKLNRN